MLVSVAVAICCFFLVRFTQLPTLGGRVIKADITGTSANLSEVSTTLTEGDTDDYDWSDDQRHVGCLSVSDLDDDNPGKRSDRHSVSCVATYMLIKPKSTIHFGKKIHLMNWGIVRRMRELGMPCGRLFHSLI